MKTKSVEDLKAIGIKEEYCDSCGKVVPIDEIGYVNGFILPSNENSLVFVGVCLCKKCMERRKHVG
ncbi:hypothetical protein J7L81_02315 [Candidatus Aerophobetes bacterium]|nr:hypothetical protein [Candidatus Aerophobetes bacterium]